MANIRDLKKDINFVLGDIIDAVYFACVWVLDLLLGLGFCVVCD